MYTNRSAKLYPAPSRRGRLSTQTLALAALIALACGGALAQEPGAQEPAAPREDGPPPMRYLPEDVRGRFASESDLKRRARLGMEIAEERLVRAALLADQERFVDATAEIGVYEAVVEDTVRTLHSSSGGGKVNNKFRDIFKRLEITLRSHVTRLESIRRVLPERHAVYLKDAIDFVRDRRDHALSAFYSDSVLREPRRPEQTRPEGERANSFTSAQPATDKKPDNQQQKQQR